MAVFDGQTKFQLTQLPGTEAQIFSWIYDRKVEVLAAETNAQAAPSPLAALKGEIERTRVREKWV